jgi:hypothetical protein
VWAPILDEATWQAVRASLATPRVIRRSDGGSYPLSESGLARGPVGRKYLLTGGLARCDVCNAPLVGARKAIKGGPKKPYLLCQPGRGGKGCVSIVLDDVERFVVVSLFSELDKPEFLNALREDDHQERRDEVLAGLSEVEGQRRELASMWSAKELTTDEWREARMGLADQEDELKQELAGIPAPGKALDIAAARGAWDEGMPLHEQREFLRMFIDRVVIKRAKPGTKRFDANRVAIDWKGVA